MQVHQKTNIFFVILIFVSQLADSCKIMVKFISKTKTPFKIQMIVPGIMQKTERVTFNKINDERKVEINGDHCQGQDLTMKWTIQTWKQDTDGQWVGAVQEIVRIDGMGHFDLVVNDNLRPVMGDRMGIYCAESIVCGGGLK